MANARELQGAFPLQTGDLSKLREEDDVVENDERKNEVQRKTKPRALFLEFGARMRTKLIAASFLYGLILIHEAGHFLAARLQGIRVSHFGVGVGPSLVEFTTTDGIKVLIGCLPIGGYVGLPQGSSNRCEKADRDLLPNRSELQVCRKLQSCSVFAPV
eukprot:1586752-Rhodomonas_salina.4